MLFGKTLQSELLSRWLKPTQKTYSLSLRKCFDLANMEVYTRSQGFLTNRAYDFYSRGDKISTLSDYLHEQAGIDGFQYVGCGDNAIVVKYADNQALRIRAAALEDQISTQEVLEAPFICPIWKEVKFLGGRLNFVPYITNLSSKVLENSINKKVAERIVYLLMRSCFESNPRMWFYDYHNFEFKFEQVGILDDFTPIIIDQGAVILASDAPKEISDKLEKDSEMAFSSPLELSVPWDGKWLDVNGVPKIELLDRPMSRILEL